MEGGGRGSETPGREARLKNRKEKVEPETLARKGAGAGGGAREIKERRRRSAPAEVIDGAGLLDDGGGGGGVSRVMPGLEALQQRDGGRGAWLSFLPRSFPFTFSHLAASLPPPPPSFTMATETIDTRVSLRSDVGTKWQKQPAGVEEVTQAKVLQSRWVEV